MIRHVFIVMLLLFSLPCLGADSQVQELIVDMIPADGKAFVRSDPPGAEIFVKKDGELLRTKAKTPGVVYPAKGDVTFLVRMEGYDDGLATVQVGDGFAKPDLIKLNKTAAAVAKASTDVGTGDDFDWQVFIDDKPVKDINGKDAKTPCTILIPDGAKVIAVAKEGYMDQRVYVPQDKARIDFLRKPMKGQSRLLYGTTAKVQTVLNTDELTEEQWNRLQGVEKKVLATEVCRTRVIVGKNESYLIVAHPNDKWSNNVGRPMYSAKGGNATYRGMPLMALCNNGKQVTSDPVKDEGEIVLSPNDDGLNDNVGFIRVKILRK